MLKVHHVAVWRVGMAQSWENLGFPTVDLLLSALASPEAAVRFLVRSLAQAGRITPYHAERAICQVLHRERLGSTDLGDGIALPHSKSDVVDHVVGIIGKSLEGVTWYGDAGDVPVRVVCLLLTPVSKPGESLRALERLSRQLRGST
jgi:PTS system nitrogen regulatory IIA component